MSSFWDRTYKILKGTIREFLVAQPYNFSAAVAFYTIFSLPAILLIIIYMASFLFSTEDVTSELYNQIAAMIGESNIDQVKEVVNNARESGKLGNINVISIAMFIFSGTTVFMALQDALNIMWHVKPKPKKAIINYLSSRLLSFGMVVSFGFILMVLLVVDTLAGYLKDYLKGETAGTMELMFESVNFIVLALIAASIFSVIYMVLPDARPNWKTAFKGALLSTLLFIAGKAGFNLYLQHSPLTGYYGVAGSFVAILLWIYFSTLILLFGAAFIKAYSEYYGHPLTPQKYAVGFKVEENKE